MTHDAARGDQRPSELLLVSPESSDQEYVRLLFACPVWRVHYAQSAREAGRFLDLRPIDVILCDRYLPDGTWVDVLGPAASAHFQPPVVVTSHLADERMWAEVLNLGGYDVLVRPFDPGEVRRVVEMALRRRPPLGGAFFAETAPVMTAP